MLLKCKRLFHRSRDIASKLLIIIHADKMSIRKKLDNFFSNKTSSFYLNLLLWNPQKQKVTSLCTFNNFNISDTRTNHLFFLPKIPRELQDCFKLTSKQFSFSKCKMFKISKLIMDKDFFTKTKKKGYSKSLFIWVIVKAHLEVTSYMTRAMPQVNFFFFCIKTIKKS